MKRIGLFLCMIFISVICKADTINLHWLNEDGSVYENSTCVIDSDLILPSTPPTKYGYTFTGWKMSNYIPIEYLESTGTQAIDTGVVFDSQNIKIILQFAATNNESSCLCGAEKKGGSTNWTFVTTFRNNKTCIWHATNTTGDSLCTNMNIGEVYTLELHQTNGIFTKTINSLSYYNNNVPSYADTSFSLFSDNYGNGNYTQKSKAKIYFTKIYDNDVLIRDFIPVLDKDGVPCMFDKVEAKFYYNAGTGQFIAGPIINE